MVLVAEDGVGIVQLGLCRFLSDLIVSLLGLYRCFVQFKLGLKLDDSFEGEIGDAKNYITSNVSSSYRILCVLTLISSLTLSSPLLSLTL